MICAPDSTHRPCDCGADSPNCEVCDEQCDVLAYQHYVRILSGGDA
jgi:hypothetical protein